VQTQTEEAPKTKEKREVSPAVPNRLQLAEHALQFHVYTAESGDYPEDFLKPEYWSLVATKFQPYDHIEVRADDGTYWAEFLVVSCDRTWARVHKLRDARLQVANEQPVDPDYKVEWKGPHKKWCVIALQPGATHLRRARAREPDGGARAAAPARRRCGTRAGWTTAWSRGSGTSPCARCRSTTTPNVDPAFGLAYGFTKPSDWIRTAGVCSDERFATPLIQYKDEAGYWYADITPIYVRYVSNDCGVRRGPVEVARHVRSVRRPRTSPSEIIFKLTSDKERVALVERELKLGSATR
jgi:hypothetical protein